MDYNQVETEVKSRLTLAGNNIVFDNNVIGQEKDDMASAFIAHVAYEAATDVVDDGMTVEQSIARRIEIAKENVSYRELFGWVNPEPKPRMGY